MTNSFILTIILCVSFAIHVHDMYTVKSSWVVFDPDAFLIYRLVRPCKNDSYLCKWSKVLAYLTHLSGSYSVAVVYVRSTHFWVAVGCCSFSSDTETTHITSLLQLMLLYRRNNSSSESCSALVVPVALEHKTPGSKEVAPPTLQAVESGGTWRKQFCCSYWYPSSVQASTAQSRWKATQV